MQENKFSLSFQNTFFTRLTAETHLDKANKWINLDLSIFPVSVQNIYKRFYQELNPEIEFDATQEIISLNFTEEGVIRDLYPPAIYRLQEEEGLVLKWGSEEFLLKFDENDNLKIGNITFVAGMEEVGRYSRITLTGVIREGKKEVFKMAFPLKVKIQKDLEAEGIAPLTVGDLSSYLNTEMLPYLLQYLRVIPEQNQSGDGSPIFKLKELPEGEEVQFVDFKSYTSKLGNPLSILITSEGQKYFCPDQTNKDIECGAIISREYPFRVTRTLGSNGKNRYNKVYGKWDVREGVLNIDF